MSIWKIGNESIERWFVSDLQQRGLRVQSLACQVGGTREDLSAKCGEIIVLLRKDHWEIVGEIPSVIRMDLIGRSVNRLGNLYDTCSGVIAKNPDALTTFARLYRRHLPVHKITGAAKVS